MTETDWLASTAPAPMLRFLRAKASGRKLRLFAVACCRRIWQVLLDEQLQQTIEVAEKFADGKTSIKELASARSATRKLDPRGYESMVVRAVWATARRDIRPAVSIASVCANAALGRYLSTTRSGKSWSVGVTEPIAPHYTTDAVEEDRKQAILCRDIFGNPFRPVAVQSAWLTSTVTQLAEAIYQERAFDRVPMLADALEDAGCTNQDILGHCRGAGEHVRGCWPVDLLLRAGHRRAARPGPGLGADCR